MTGPVVLCIIEQGFFSSVAFFPLQIGDHVFVGEGSIINTAVVNSYVYIGKDVVIVSFVSTDK